MDRCRLCLKESETVFDTGVRQYLCACLRVLYEGLGQSEKIISEDSRVSDETPRAFLLSCTVEMNYVWSRGRENESIPHVVQLLTTKKKIKKNLEYVS